MHELEMVNNEASFAYRIEGGPPWHGLGVALSGHQTKNDILVAAKADYKVISVPVSAHYDGTEFEIEDRYATGRVSFDGVFEPWEVVKGRYQVVQNEVVVQKALDVVGASDQDAVMDTAGVLNDGRRFFATIDLGQVVIDPAGVNDVIGRFLVVSTSHDGSSPIQYANTDIRGVCSNTVRLGLQTAKSTFTARHTTNVQDRLDEAGQVLGIASDWSREFAAEAEQLLRIPVPVGSKTVDRVLDAIWPEKDADTDRKRANRDGKIESIKWIFRNDRNAGGYGENAWSLVNAVGEYLDHHRSVPVLAAAQQSMEVANLIHRQKLVAHSAVKEFAVL